jgi:hypothetical protein
MDSKADAILAIIFVLNLAAHFAPKIIRPDGEGNQVAAPEYPGQRK